MNSRLKASLVSLFLTLFAVPAAIAQATTATESLRKLCDRLSKPTTILSADDAAKAESELDGLKLDEATLKPDDRGRVAAIRALAALARGDAAAAGKHHAELVASSPTAAMVPEIAWLTASATGNAQLGDETLRKMGEKAAGDAKKQIARRRAWLADIGKDAPEISIKTEDGNEFEAARRGDRALIIDFWNVLAAPSPDDAKRMVKFYETFRESEHVEFVGVNSDAAARLARAKDFAEKNGYVWPQCYETPTGKAPITVEAFHVGAPPWMTLVDTYGFVRAAGDAGEPGFHYAVRAALAEAAGTYPAVMPRTRDGKQPPGAGGPVAGKDKKSNKPGVEKDLPSNPEAEKLLREAHAFRRTGMKTKAKETYQKIMNEFPGTKEAKEAQFWLED